MANNTIKVRRTTVSGRTPNTTSSGNSQYINQGELAINLTDQVLYSSDGTNLITFGATNPSVYTNNAIFFPIGGALSVGNSTANLTVNNSGVYVGNTIANAYVFPTAISVSNSSSNSSINPQSIFVGNSVSNASISIASSTNSINLTSFSITATGVGTVNTQVSHGLLLATGLTAKFSGVNGLINDRNITIASLPAANQFTFAFGATDVGNALKISAISRSGGVATVNTWSNHSLTSGLVVGISGTTSIDGGKFETSTSAAKTITVLTPNSFTISNMSADVTKTVTAYSVAAIAKASAGAVTLTLTSTSHGFAAGDYVTLSGYSSSLIIGGITYTAAMLNTRWLISAVATNTFSVVLRQKLTNETAVAAASGVFSASAKRTYDFSQVILSASAYITPIIPTTALTPSTANASVLNPVYISVSNSSTSARITPSTIYVGSGTNTVIIDAIRGAKFGAVGSILQTSVDGTGFKVGTLQSDLGAFDENANAFFANASVVSVGNSTISTLITSTTVQSNVVFSGDNNQNVSINSTSLAINYSGNQAIISGTYASFPYSISVGGHLSLTGTVVDGANNTANSTYNTLYGNDSAIYWNYPGLVTIGDTASAPTTPPSGTLWWNSDQGTMKIYYNDGNSSQWVDAARGTQGPVGPMYGSRLTASADGTSITPNASTTDVVTHINTQIAGTLTINAPTGTLTDGQKLMFRIKSTNIQTLSWNAIYAGGADLTLPSATSGSSLTDYYGFIYNSGATKWHLLSKISGF